MKLGISPRTVEFHRAHIMEKTGARDCLSSSACGSRHGPLPESVPWPQSVPQLQPPDQITDRTRRDTARQLFFARVISRMSATRPKAEHARPCKPK